ncbi:MAG: response regulator [Chloroflexota bacterium]
MSHVLIVDDNEMNREILSRQLKREGHTSAVAEDGLDAWNLLQSQPFDLVLLDLMMPKMDGFGVLERLKADPSLQQIPVIVLSAENDLDNIVRCIELGAEDYLLKPYNSVLLKSRVAHCLERYQLLNTMQANGLDMTSTQNLMILSQTLHEPVMHSMHCVDQLLSRAGGSLNTDQAELLGIIQSRLAEMLVALNSN